MSDHEMKEPTRGEAEEPPKEVARTLLAGLTGALVVVVIVAVIAGWSRLSNWIGTTWDLFTGWWTPGWGNLFTVVVAGIALGVSAWFNARTLKNAQDQFRQSRADSDEQFRQGRADSEEKFRQSRIDARNDKLRVEIATFLSVLDERVSLSPAFSAQLEELNATVKTAQSDAESGTGPTQEQLKAYAKGAKAAVDEIIAELYNRLSRHGFSIRMLTTDRNITEPVARIDTGMTEQLKDIHSLIQAVGKATTPAKLLVLLGQLLKLALKATAFEKVLREERDRLKNYCLDHLPISDAPEENG